MGTLFIVGTPIGNLGDLTDRAACTLRQVSVVVAEDTRRARKLLAHLGAAKKLISYHANSPESREDVIIECLRTGDVALISDAGTPGISDPGPDLIARARAEDCPVVPIPGPSALATALSVVSFARQPVTFIGFLPERRIRRERLIRRVATTAETLVIYLPPHNAVQRIAELLDWLGPVPAALCRELTKFHEDLREALLSDLHAALVVEGARGEITLVLDVAEIVPADPPNWDELEGALIAAMDAGVAPSRAAAGVARTFGVPKERVYALATELRRTNRS